MARIGFFFSVVVIFFVASPVIGDEPKRLEVAEREWQEFLAFKQWKRLRGYLDRKNSIPHFLKFENRKWRIPTKDENPAVMARFIVNQANWTSVATISSREDILSFPFAGVASVSDGPFGNGSGIPYMYLTPLDLTAQDLAKDSRATLMMTLAQGSWCTKKLMDPMDPRCARIGLSGEIKKIQPDDLDYDIARDAVFGRHPWLSHMPNNHHFFLAKLNIQSIIMLDAFGGPKYIPVEDYLSLTSFNDIKLDEISPVYRSVYLI